MSEDKKIECPCFGNCENATKCEVCTAHHRKVGTLVMCMRPIAEKTYGPKRED